MKKSLKKIVQYAHAKNLKKGLDMYCTICDSRYSGNPSDYFWANPNEIFKCHRKTMILIPSNM